MTRIHNNAYESKLCEMKERAVNWRKRNPQKLALVQFNFPPEVEVVAEISLAIEMHYVTCNDAGLELVKSLGHWGKYDEPTVMMVRNALEGS